LKPTSRQVTLTEFKVASFKSLGQEERRPGLAARSMRFETRHLPVMDGFKRLKLDTIMCCLAAAVFANIELYTLLR